MTWRVAPGRVGERAEEVEDRAHGELLAHRDDEARRAVVRRREHEAEADLARCSARRPSGARSIRTPSASSTSAEPDRPVAERLPCLATAQPAPAAISAAVVETLNVWRPPPVPAVSIRSSRPVVTGAAKRAHRRARPASSSTVSPFVRSAIRNAAVSVSDALPAMISASTAASLLRVRSSREASASIASVRTGFGTGSSPAGRLPVRRQHRLGMELDALRGQLAVADAHDHAAAASR